MMFDLKIIEDCSPYYVRFTHKDIDKVINIAAKSVEKVNFTNNFTHYKLNKVDVECLKKFCPLFSYYDLSEKRVSMFVSKPGLFYKAHKDAHDHKFGFNYTVKVLDNKCVTSWFSDEELQSYPIIKFSGESRSRECDGFKPDTHIPLHTMIAQPNECILFNTNIFHSWDNRYSENERMILTLRLIDYSQENTDFSNARAKLLSLAIK